MEIWHALSDLSNNKSPSPDDYTSEFFKKQNILKYNIKGVFQDFFEKANINANFNDSYMPYSKKTEAKLARDYRPISLTTCLYKVVARVLSKRHNKVLPHNVSKNQFAFVADHLECSHKGITKCFLKMSPRTNWLLWPTIRSLMLPWSPMSWLTIIWDPRRLEWWLSLILRKHLLQWTWIGSLWTTFWLQNVLTIPREVMGCISLASSSIVINGRPRGKIKATQGLSPFYSPWWSTALAKC